jgi:hypothetical protein
MNRLKLYFVSFLLIVLASNCKKEDETFTIIYEVEVDNYESYSTIQFTKSDGAISGGKLEELNWKKTRKDNGYYKWSYKFSTTEGLDIYFSGLQSFEYGELITRLYVNGELQQTAVSSSSVRSIIRYTL